MQQEAQSLYRQDRSAAYDALAAKIVTYINKVPLTVSFQDHRRRQSFVQTAERNVWQLLLNGLHHLKQGEPVTDNSTFQTAVQKASLTAAPLAISIGVLPADIQTVTGLNPADNFSNGFKEALAFAEELMTDLETDLKTVVPTIEERIARLQKSPQEEMQPLIRAFAGQNSTIFAFECAQQDPDFFMRLKKAHHGQGPDPMPETAVRHFHDFVKYSFHALKERYGKALKKFRQDIIDQDIKYISAAPALIINPARGI